MAVGGLEKQIEAVRRPSADESQTDSQSHPSQTKRRRCLHDVDIIIRGDEGTLMTLAFIK